MAIARGLCMIGVWVAAICLVDPVRADLASIIGSAAVDNWRVGAGGTGDWGTGVPPVCYLVPDSQRSYGHSSTTSVDRTARWHRRLARGEATMNDELCDSANRRRTTLKGWYRRGDRHPPIDAGSILSSDVSLAGVYRRNCRMAGLIATRTNRRWRVPCSIEGYLDTGWALLPRSSNCRVDRAVHRQ
jgi:hypothetical protein